MGYLNNTPYPRQMTLLEWLATLANERYEIIAENYMDDWTRPAHVAFMVELNAIEQAWAEWESLAKYGEVVIS